MVEQTKPKDQAIDIGAADDRFIGISHGTTHSIEKIGNCMTTLLPLFP